MKSLIKTTTLSLLSATSLSFSFGNQAQALINHQPPVNYQKINNETIYYPDSEIQETQVQHFQQSETLISLKPPKGTGKVIGKVVTKIVPRIIPLPKPSTPQCPINAQYQCYR